MLIDDDGVGYIAYTAMAPFGKLPNGTLKPGPAGPHGHPAGFKGDHMVAIERLTPVRKMPFSGRDVPSENLEFAKTGSGETHEERSVCVFNRRTCVKARRSRSGGSSPTILWRA